MGVSLCFLGIFLVAACGYLKGLIIFVLHPYMVYGRSNVHDGCFTGNTDGLGRQTDGKERQDLDMTWLVQEINQPSMPLASYEER